MRSFAYAFRGVVETLLRERHMRIHLCIAFYVVFSGFICEIEPYEWTAVLLCIAIVLGSELLNSGIERFYDEVMPARSRGVRHGKDAAAGGVLVSALIAAVIGSMVFFTGGRPAAALEWFSENRVMGWALAALIVPWLLFIIFGGRKNR